MVRKGCVQVFLYVFALILFWSFTSVAVANDYTVQCGSVRVISNSDGTNTVVGEFKLFKGGAPANDLTASEFNVYEDGALQVSSIKTPGSAQVKKADIVFAMDVSGSMQDEIDKVKDNIENFVKKLRDKSYDVRLGLITFGALFGDNPKEYNNGDFYKTTQDFIKDVSSLTAYGSREYWFDALVLASQYPFREGASRVVILITDEPGDTLNYNLDSALPVIKANGIVVYAISYNNLSTVAKVVNETKGELYYILDDFSDVLDKIANSISNTYTYSFVSNAGPGEHTAKVEIALNGVYCEQTYKIGANPVIALTADTEKLVKDGINAGTDTVVLSAQIKDDGQVVEAKINVDGFTSGFEDMVAVGGDTYEFEVVGLSKLSVGDCVTFRIKAIDDEGRTSIKGPWSVCVSNRAPEVKAISPENYEFGQPVEVTAEVEDPDGHKVEVSMRYREKGEASWKEEKMVLDGGVWKAEIPADAAGIAGIEVQIVARDEYGAEGSKTKLLKVKEIPVKVVSVTRLSDTLDKGPFPVWAVVSGVDISQGGSVDLEYKINGSVATVPMQLSVTGTSAPMPVNSNIYVAEIPTVSPGDEVCYRVLASNPTASDASQEVCFEVLTPVEPLAVTPASVVLVKGEEVEFVATGGYGSYKWQTISGSLSTTLGDKVRYRAEMVGADKVVVEDLRGFRATAIVQVLPPLDILPSDVNGASFAPSTELVLKAVGGEPPYTWNVDGAKFVVKGTDNETVIVTLGEDPVEVKVTLEDSKGRIKEISFNNMGTLRIDPSGEVSLAPGDSKTFVVSGGKPPYKWDTEGGDVEVNGTEGVYKAPGVPGVYHLTVTDASGQKASVVLKVGEPLRVTPTQARIMRGESVEFTVVSGVGPFKWEAEYGKLSSATGEKVTYTPEDVVGLYVVRVYDSAGSVKELYVQVMEGLTVTPANPTVKLGESVELTVVGGTGDYTWSAERGKVSPIDGSKVTYTPPEDLGDGKDRVVVRDSAGNEAVVEIKIVAAIINELMITPEEVTLAPGEKVEFNVANQVGDVKWTATGGVITGDGIYTAPDKAGVYRVTATDLANGRQAHAKVVVKSQLVLTPTKATVSPGGSVEFEVKGGVSPYVWKVDGEGILSSVEGEKVTFTASARSGVVKVVVVDAEGEVAEAEVEVVGALKITPSSVTLPRGGVQQFYASGGVGKLTWTAEAGDIDDKGLYTAPEEVGVYHVTVTDEAGNKAVATVTVGNIPVITPGKAWVEKGGTYTFRVSGGNPPYSWTVSAGSIDPSGEEVEFRAPEVETEVTVRVEDASGQTAEAVVYVDLPLKVSREEIYLAPGETAEIAVVGGVPPFEWGAEKGILEQVVTEDAGVNVYKAPVVMGDDVITVRDRRGEEVKVKVHVMRPLVVTPAIRYMKRESQKEFTVTGGVPPYTAVVKDGDGDISPTTCEDDPCVFTFTSGSVADQQVVIEFRDNAGHVVTAQAWVETRLKATPMVIYVDRGGQAKFKVYGGTGGYEVVATSGFAEVDPETGEGVYEAPNRYGEYLITVYDSSDNSVEITVKVERMEPAISPSKVVAKAGGRVTLMVSRGAPPFEWAFEGGKYECKTTDCSVVELEIPERAGTFEVEVEDAAGNKAEAEVQVTLPLVVSPESFTVYRGEDVKVKIEAVGGVPPYDWVLGDLEEVSRGENYVVVRPRTDVEVGKIFTVTCRDASGAEAKMNIVLSLLPGDVNGDGVLSEDEFIRVVTGYFEGETVGGVEIDEDLLYRHLKSFLSGELSQ